MLLACRPSPINIVATDGLPYSYRAFHIPPAIRDIGIDHFVLFTQVNRHCVILLINGFTTIKVDRLIMFPVYNGVPLHLQSVVRHTIGEKV